MQPRASVLGFPRIGVARELKKSQEAYWKGKASREDLLTTASALRARHWAAMRERGVDTVPCNDFSLYDQVLDMAVMLGAVPARYQVLDDALARYFAMARGHQAVDAGVDLPALEMTKWFDTNYHYIVPELEVDQAFQLNADKLLGELAEARALGIEPRPVVLGPVTFLRLSKMAAGAPDEARPLQRLTALLPIYEALLERLAAEGVQWVQLDEPCLVGDLDAEEVRAYQQALPRLAAVASRPKLMLTTYFGALGDNLHLAQASGFEGLHVDLARAPFQLDEVLSTLPASVTLSVGVVDGRNVWRADLHTAHQLVRRATSALGQERVQVAPSCSLLHVPVDLDAETKLDAELLDWTAFALQKLSEVCAVAEASGSADPGGTAFEASRRAREARRESKRIRSEGVRRKMDEITPAMLARTSPFEARDRAQHQRFKLPPFPTTTIGSFPQTGDVRGARAAWRAGKTPDSEYQAFLRVETERCIRRQESLGIDVLVHGEFERTDMVEYFGEKLEGFAFTQNGWVQSYGSRCVKPPLLFGDVSRPSPMTVEWASYSQGLTRRPMKGMLTGPVTILQWSFVRDDQPRSETCRQIALALRDEVLDLETAGIGMIQVDEPALREGLPLRRAEWSAYLRWAVDAFRLAVSGVRDETQVHTHMCYSEFGDILDAIAEMDADVISIETSRSKMELLGDFGRFRYPNEIGPGVYDIHSPRVPTQEEMLGLLERASQVVPYQRLWVNPDCGLKTRGWAEVEPALAAMTKAARQARKGLVTRRKPERS